MSLGCQDSRQEGLWELVLPTPVQRGNTAPYRRCPRCLPYLLLREARGVDDHPPASGGPPGPLSPPAHLLQQTQDSILLCPSPRSQGLLSGCVPAWPPFSALKHPGCQWDSVPATLLFSGRIFHSLALLSPDGGGMRRDGQGQRAGGC